MWATYYYYFIQANEPKIRASSKHKIVRYFKLYLEFRRNIFFRKKELTASLTDADESCRRRDGDGELVTMYCPRPARTASQEIKLHLTCGLNDLLSKHLKMASYFVVSVARCHPERDGQNPAFSFSQPLIKEAHETILFSSNWAFSEILWY